MGRRVTVAMHPQQGRKAEEGRLVIETSELAEFLESVARVTHQ